eukprot:3695137-Rhodomonas_salina.2
MVPGSTSRARIGYPGREPCLLRLSGLARRIAIRSDEFVNRHSTDSLLLTRLLSTRIPEYPGTPGTQGRSQGNMVHVGARETNPSSREYQRRFCCSLSALPLYGVVQSKRRQRLHPSNALRGQGAGGQPKSVRQEEKGNQNRKRIVSVGPSSPRQYDGGNPQRSVRCDTALQQAGLCSLRNRGVPGRQLVSRRKIEFWNRGLYCLRGLG